MVRTTAIILAITAYVWGAPVRAQVPTPYGASINLAGAKMVIAAAEEAAKKITPTPYVIAVVDPGGYLIYFEREDNAQLGSVRVAIDKARSAVLFRRPTKAFEDAVAGGRNALLGLRGAVPLEGGLPLLSDGKIVGAVGASGGTAPQDGQVAKAGAGAVK
jgi:glc operon protein GlcG